MHIKPPGDPQPRVPAETPVLKDEETRLEYLRAAMREGEESGLAVTLDWNDFISRKRAEQSSK